MTYVASSLYRFFENMKIFFLAFIATPTNPHLGVIQDRTHKLDQDDLQIHGCYGQIPVLHSVQTPEMNPVNSALIPVLIIGQIHESENRQQYLLKRQLHPKVTRTIMVLVEILSLMKLVFGSTVKHIVTLGKYLISCTKWQFLNQLFHIMLILMTLSSKRTQGFKGNYQGEDTRNLGQCEDNLLSPTLVHQAHNKTQSVMIHGSYTLPVTHLEACAHTTPACRKPVVSV